MTDSPKPILILGVGNTLLKDEGVGVHVVRRLQAMDLSDNVEVMEGGVLGLDLLDHLEDRDKVVIVDAVDGGDEPGSIYRLTRADIEEGKTHCHMSLHEIDLPQVFATADYLGLKVDPIIIGIEPKDMDVAYDELTPEVEAAIPQAIALVLKEIGQ